MAATEFGSTGLFNDTSCKAYYKGESTADSKGANTLTNNNTVAFSAAKFNNGFDGGSANTNKSMSVANALSWNGGAYSISLWVKLNTEITTGTYCFAEIADSVTGTTLCVDYNSNAGSPQIEVFRLRAGISGGNVQAVQSLGTSVFHHMVVSYDGTTVTGYIDGASFGTPATNTGNGSGITSGFKILTDRNSSNFASAIVDDVVCFNRALTASEVLMLFQGGIAVDLAANSADVAAANTYSGSATWSGTNRALCIDVSMLGAGVTVSSMTYGGAACTFIGSKATVTSLGSVECWRILASDSGAPAAGANTLVVNLSSSIEFSVEWVSYTGVHQTSPTEGFNSAQATNAGSATDASVAITTVADRDWVHAAVVANDTSITANQTTRNNISGTLGSGANEDNGTAKSPAGAVTMSYTNLGITTTWAIAGYGLRDINASTLAATARLRSLLGVGL